MPLTAAELAALRQEYSTKGLTRGELCADPLEQFGKWLAEAQESGLTEPNAMILSTVDAAGQPWTRTVLLKGCDARGFVFFTNYTGAKAAQIAQEARVAMTFFWVALERQVNITGRASRVTREESAAYFAARPRASQLGAWASQQSAVIADRAQLHRQYAEAEARFSCQAIPLPPNWGGYVVAPETMEFWQGHANRLHDRLRFTRSAVGAWKVERLSP